MGRIIVITSGKGGVGKTTIAASLGYMLARLGKTVALVEGDIGLNNLDVAMGLESAVRYDICDVMMGRCTLAEASVCPGGMKNLYVLAGVHGEIGRDGDIEFGRVCKSLERGADFVLIDSPAGLERSFYRAMTPAKEGIVVTTPHISAVKDADKTASVLSLYGVNVLGIAVNRVRWDLVRKGLAVSPEDLVGVMKRRLLASLPEDDELGMAGSLMLGGGKVSVATYRDFAELLSSDDIASRGGKRR